MLWHPGFVEFVAIYQRIQVVKFVHIFGQRPPHELASVCPLKPGLKLCYRAVKLDFFGIDHELNVVIVDAVVWLWFINVHVLISDNFRISVIQDLPEFAIFLGTATTAIAAHQLWLEGHSHYLLVARIPSIASIPLCTVEPFPVGKRTLHIRIDAIIFCAHADCLSDAEDSSSSEGCLDHVLVGELLLIIISN